MNEGITRRDFFRAAGAAGAAAWSVGLTRTLWAQATTRPASPTVPAIAIGKQKFSRLMLDELPFTGNGHHRYVVCKAMFEYYTPERVLQTLKEAGRCGVDTFCVAPGRNARVLGRDEKVEGYDAYVADGGRVRKLVVELTGKTAALPSTIRRVADRDHVAGIFLPASKADGIIRGGRGWNSLVSWLQAMRATGRLVGVATSRTDVLDKYEKYAGKGLLPIDFYVQNVCPTFEYRAEDRRKALEAISEATRPVILRRILPADAAPKDAREALAETFEAMAPKDAVCLGVFTKDDPDQVRRYASWTVKWSPAKEPPRDG